MVTHSSAQNGSSDSRSKSPQPAPEINAKILYTGRLFGYFRIPDRQPGQGQAAGQCPPVSENTSAEVTEFLKQAAKDPNTVLVGTGDNFAPSLLSRTLDDPGSPDRRHKEDYVWDWVKSEWIKNDDTSALSAGISEAIIHGQGRIPMDNVGCFLARAGFDAIVPGKHDFYFGPEHVRYLARFLAGFPKSNQGYRPVQMLAANLVVETDYASKESPSPDKIKGVDYLTPGNSGKSWDEVLPVNIRDGEAVLPWLQTITIKSPKKDLTGVSAELCETSRDDPYRRVPNQCHSLANPVRIDDQWQVSITELAKTEIQARQHSDLKPGTNYMICFSDDSPKPYCARFSTYSPFFQFKTKDWPVGQGQKDPDPYVVVDLKNGTRVAIFGVVDQNLREHVGSLNFAWINKSSSYKTEIKVLDPARALKQLLQKFDREHKEFTGLKVLLAQMTAPEAKQLASQLGGTFNVVVSQAQLENATPDQELIVDLTGTTIDKKSPRDGLRTGIPLFLAVPPPYYNPESKTRAVQVRQLSVRKPMDNAKWRFSLTAPEKNPGQLHDVAECAVFDAQLSKTLSRLNITPAADQKESFSLLTRLVMQKEIDADVALIQQRDIFWGDRCDSKELQDQLDRILWKGDFLIRRHIRGKILTDVMARSEHYDADDQSALSLESEKARGLIAFGMTKDKTGKGYLINGAPVDPSRLYTVAMTDYIALADTGFPELAEVTTGDPVRPSDFRRLDYISSRVCAEMAKDFAPDTPVCQASEDAKYYFDENDQLPTDGSPRINTIQRAIGWAFPSLNSPERPLRLNPGSSPEERQQDRPIFSVSLENATFGFSSTKHGLTEQERSQRFAGLSIPQLNARQSHSWDFDQKLKVSQTGRFIDLFAFDELRYIGDVTRQEKGPTITNQKTNSLVLGGGFYLHSTKELPRLLFQVAPRYETQLADPINVLTLASGNGLTFHPGRTESMLVRLGPRWQNIKSSIEGGYELGSQFNAIKQFVFNPGDASQVVCQPTAQVSLQACVTQNSGGPAPLITSGSVVEEVREQRFRHGLFLNWKLVIPITAKIAYTVENQGDFFFTRRPDNSTDTRYQDDLKQTLSIPLFGNLYFEPKFEVFLYQNKVDRHSFWQTQTSFTVSYKFDWFKGNGWWSAMAYKNPDSKPGSK
jgi:hypothetical protein